MSVFDFSQRPLLDLVLLDRYLAGESPSDERACVEAWLAADPAHEQRLHILQGVGAPHLAVRGGKGSSLDVDRAWVNVAGVRQLPRRTSTVFVASSPRHVLRGWGWHSRLVSREMWYVVAGLVIGVMGLVAGWRITGLHVDKRGAPSTTAVYTTAKGQRANITLPDGSVVALNVASTLSFPLDYAAGNRTVRLSGEGLFTVRRHEGSPFTVIAGSATIRVLGTSFVVRHYATDTTTTVAVRDGKVAVRSVVLTAAEEAQVNGAGVIRVRPLDPARFGFATGTLTLDAVRLSDAIADLDRWYDVDIRLGDSVLAARRLVGEYAAGSIGELQDILEGTFNVRVMRDGRILTLYSR